MSQAQLSSLWTSIESTQSLPALLPNQLQVWRIDLPGLDESNRLLEQCTLLLNEPERRRAQRRMDPQARMHSAIGRGCLRTLLGAALKINPRDVPLRSSANGKPQLPNNDVAFNVAHSGNRILIALFSNSAVGIDVEQIDPQMDFLPVARDSLTPAEFGRLAAITEPAEQRRAFYRYWVRKEAIAKADGRGLMLPLDSFEVSTELTEAASVGLNGRVFHLSDLTLDDDFAAAVALESSGYSTILRRFPHAISLN